MDYPLSMGAEAFDPAPRRKALLSPLIDRSDSGLPDFHPRMPHPLSAHIQRLITQSLGILDTTMSG